MIRILLLSILISMALAVGAADGVDTFNYAIGTQTFSPSYQFTDEPKLIETARAILAFGSNTIKFKLGGERRRDGRTSGTVSIRAEARTPNRSLAELAAGDPVYRQVFAMPFAFYLMWVEGPSSGGYKSFRPGAAGDAEQKEYREIYDLTRYLLRTFNGSGKQFYLGHWEGDWLLVGAGSKRDPEPEDIEAMTRWLNVRQRAVEDARRATPHAGVEVWHYTEVNLARKAMAGGRTLTNDVLPRVDVDYVSYSAYDSLTGDLRKSLIEALDYIESKLNKKEGVPGRRVFIGEYGFPAIRFGPDQQAERSREVMRAGIEWGCPFVLYWEMYNNEVDKDGKQRGFWLIDDKGVKQPVYELHRKFLEEARKYVEGVRKETGRAPGEMEFRKRAVEILGKL